MLRSPDLQGEIIPCGRKAVPCPFRVGHDLRRTYYPFAIGRIGANFSNIILWLDPQRDVSVKQKFVEPGGNYRLTHYTDIEINGKISNDVFELKTPAGTTTVRP